MRVILAELAQTDPEHPDTWLSHESGWTLSISETGIAVWDNLETDTAPRYVEGMTVDEALRLWLLLSKGSFSEIERQTWKDGSGPPVTSDERDRRQKEAADITLRLQREFYDTLGPEDATRMCRRSGCTRGTVAFSVLCRPHHFESLYKQPCPFSD